VLPAGGEPHEPHALVEVDRRWDEVRFTDLLADAGVRDPFGLPGVQDKASARMLSVPLRKAGLRYILKVDPPEYPRVVEDEKYFLDLARRARFPAASAEVVHDADGRSGLLVQRFDRVADSSGSTRRLAVEDATQVLGLYPAAKYDVTTERLAAALADLCPARAVALRDVYRQVLFAWLTGNGDLHAKNVAVRQDETGEWRIAPAYDLPSTLPYGDRTMALTVGGRRDGLSRRRLLELAADLGIPERAAVRVLDDVRAAVAPVLDEWVDETVSPFPRAQSLSTLRVLRNRLRTAGP
jgi:serine/threonine-protein kinase HipA